MQRRQVSTCIVNGRLLDLKPTPTRQEIGSRLPWRTGTASIVTKTSRVSVMGRIPLISPALRMTFTYNATSEGNKLSDKNSARLDKRSVRLTAAGMREVFSAELTPELQARASSVFINLYCAVNFEEHRRVAALFDRDNGTACEPLMALLQVFIEEVTRDDTGAQKMIAARSLLVAQMMPLMHSLFDVDFFDLMLVPFKDLMRLFLKMHRDGPLIAFKRHVFTIDSRGFCGNQRGMTPGEMQELQNAPRPTNPEEADALVPEERREIVLQLRCKRAIDLWRLQRDLKRVDVSVGEDPVAPSSSSADDDGDDEEKETTAVSLFGVGVKRSASGTQPGGAGTKGPFELKASNEEGAPVLVSTNGRLTVGVPLDMRRLTQQQWTMLMITEALHGVYSSGNHFGFTHAKMLDIFEFVSQQEDFPVRSMTPALMNETVLSMVDDGQLRVVDLDKGCFVEASVLRERFPGGMFDGAIHPLFYGLPWIVDREEKLASLVGSFLKDKLAATKERSQDMTRTKCLWNLPSGVQLEKEQRRALAHAAVLPLTFVNGAGGTGKSLVMRVDFERHRRMYPDHRILCTAFKNDTVNQMRMALGFGENKPETVDTRVYFRTVDSFVTTGGVIAPAPSDKGEGELGPVPIDDIIVDEAAMLSTEHVKGLLDKSDLQRLCQIKMYGDGDQLPPIMAGTPFCVLMKMLPTFTITLERNFRTAAPTLTKYMMSVRARDFSNVAEFFDDPAPLSNSEIEQTQTYTLQSSYLISDVACYRDSPKVFGDRILDIVRRIDPDRKMYADMMSVTPYRYMAEFVSVMLDMHYFAKESDPVGEALKATSTGTRIRPTLYRGGYAVVMETDKNNKAIARGRVALITNIVDHPYRQTVDPTATTIPPGWHSLESTALPIPRGWQRAIVLDGRTVADFSYDYAITNVLQPGACRTIHRAQGDQKKIVLCLFPTGAMSNVPIWYTGISRAQELCITFATTTTLATMSKTEPEPCMSAQESFLKAELALCDDLGAMVTVANGAATVCETLHGVEEHMLDLIDMEVFDGIMGTEAAKYFE